MYRSRVRPSKKRFAAKMRRNPTDAERVLRRHLNQTAYRWQFQCLVRGWILDLYCSKVRLAVEVDGSSHDSRKKQDAARDAALRKLGLITIRFTNEQVLADPAKVTSQIIRLCDSLPHYTTWNQGRRKKTPIKRTPSS